MRVRGSFSRHPTVARCTMTWSLRLSGGVVVPMATQANLALPRSCSEDRRAGEAGEVSRFRAGEGGACHVITAPAITMPTMHFDTPSSFPRTFVHA